MSTNNHEHRLALLRALKVFGVTHIRAEYSGGGDSGQIDSVDFFRNDTPLSTKEENELGEFTYEEEYTEWNGNKSTERIRTKHGNPDAIIEQWAYEFLEKTNATDWVNNEGGYGTFTIDLTFSPPKLSLDHHYYIQQTNDEYYEEALGPCQLIDEEVKT